MLCLSHVHITAILRTHKCMWPTSTLNIWPLVNGILPEKMKVYRFIFWEVRSYRFFLFVKASDLWFYFHLYLRIQDVVAHQTPYFICFQHWKPREKVFRFSGSIALKHGTRFFQYALSPVGWSYKQYLALPRISQLNLQMSMNKSPCLSQGQYDEPLCLMRSAFSRVYPWGFYPYWNLAGLNLGVCYSA